MTTAPHAAAVRGDDYQFVIGWYWACRALTELNVQSVSLEDAGAGHFDDLVVRYHSGAASYKQVKSSNAADVVITEDWLTTAVTPTGKSPLQHFYSTWKSLHEENANSDFAIVTNRGLDHTDPILKLRDNMSALVTGSAYASATSRSNIGKAKQRWASHLNITIDELTNFLNYLKFETEGGESSWDRQAKDAMRGAGLRTDDDALARGKEMVKSWIKNGKGAQEVDAIRKQVGNAGLLARAGTLILAVDAIDRPNRSIVPNLTLDWVDLYDGDSGYNRRQLHNPDDWSNVILPDIKIAAKTLESFGVHRVHLMGAMRLPTWFALGTQLPRVRGWILSLDQNGDEWRTDTTPASLTAITTELAVNRGTDLAVAIVLSQNPTNDVLAHINERSIPVKTLVSLSVPAGPGMSSLTDDAHALSWAASARDVIIQRVRATGATKIHIFMAAPAGAALMLGYYWNMLPPTLVYEHLGNTYSPTFTIS